MPVRSAAAVLALALGFVTSTPANAYAYIDPATGSLVLQGLVGALMAGLYLLKTYWTQLKVWLGRGPAGTPDAPSPEPTPGDGDQ